MKKITKIVLVVAALIGVIFVKELTPIVGKKYAEQYLDKENAKYVASLTADLQNESNEVNKTLPVVVDEVTRFDYTKVIHDKYFVYHYTIIAKGRTIFDDAQGFIDTSNAQIAAACQDKGVLVWLARGAVFVFEYQRDKEKPVTIVVDQGQCNQAIK
jgi:hypothetical protein